MGVSENDKKYKVTIVIDGVSAQDLFAVGPNDLRDYFLPERLGVDPNDVRQIHMGEDMTPEEFGASLVRERKTFKHVDSFIRDDFDDSDCEA